jgi:hypothetical protein
MSTTLTLPEFRTWLESHEPNAVVGESRSVSRCPVARFLGGPGERRVCVGGAGYTDASDTPHSTPAWASRFIHRIDGNVPGRPKPITAREALDILREIEA